MSEGAHVNAVLAWNRGGTVVLLSMIRQAQQNISQSPVEWATQGSQCE